MKRFGRLLQEAFVSSFFVGAALPSLALTITIDDSTDGVVFTSDSPTTVGHLEGESPFFTDPAIGFTGTRRLVLTEPRAVLVGGLTPVSDVIDMSGNRILFESDEESPLGLADCTFVTCFQETDGFLDITAALFGPGGAPPNFHLSVRSDIDVVSNVPEPETASLMGLGLAALALACSRKARYWRRNPCGTELSRGRPASRGSAASQAPAVNGRWSATQPRRNETMTNGVIRLAAPALAASRWR